MNNAFLWASEFRAASITTGSRVSRGALATAAPTLIRSAYIGMAYVGMAYIVMAYIVMVYIVMAA